MDIVTQSPVCVTGASGFVASQIVSDLLNRGYRVRGTVRDAEKPDKYRFLRDLPGAAQRLELVSADLTHPSTFESAVTGCEYVLHTASPYVLTVKDPQQDLVDPAVKGTQGVLEACHQTSGVKRLVVTSSMAAITDEPENDHILTEQDWNEKSSLERNPYYYSKTLAERTAWDFVESQQPEFDLVVINPFLVIGPSLTPSLNTSNRVFLDLLAGKLPGIVNVAWGLVDVRDVAIAHRRAFEKPEASGRYVCAAETRSMREVVEALHQMGYTDYPLPKIGLDSPAGDVLVRLSTYFQPKGTAQFLRTNLGRRPKFDNSKIQNDLGLTFRSFEETLAETVEDLLRWGHLEPVGA